MLETAFNRRLCLPMRNSCSPKIKSMQNSSRVKLYSLPLFLLNHSSPKFRERRWGLKLERRRRRRKRGKIFLELAQLSANHRSQFLIPLELDPHLLCPWKDNHKEMRGGRTLIPSETRTFFLRAVTVTVSLPLPILPLSLKGTAGIQGIAGIAGIEGIAETTGTEEGKETTGNLQILRMSS